MPAREADFLTGRRAREVAEVVFPRPAEVLAALAVVIGVAGDAVLEANGGVLRDVGIGGPFLADVQQRLSRQAAYQRWNKCFNKPLRYRGRYLGHIPAIRGAGDKIVR